jgi:hypothetical protein
MAGIRKLSLGHPTEKDYKTRKNKPGAIGTHL